MKGDAQAAGALHGKDKEKSKKRKSTVDDTQDDAGPSTKLAKTSRNAPGSGYARVCPNPAVDLSGLATGRCELWMLQLPIDLKVSDLNGAKVEVPADARDGQGSTFAAGRGNGAGSYALVPEAASLAAQLSIVTPVDAAGTVKRFPVARRITVTRDLSALQPPLDPYDDVTGAGTAAAAAAASSKTPARRDGGKDVQKEKEKEKKSEKKEKHKDKKSEKKKSKKDRDDK